MRFKNTPIQLKLIKVILLTTGTVLVLTTIAYMAYQIVTFGNTTKKQLSTIGKIIAGNSTAALAFDSKEEAFDILSVLQVHEHIVAAVLFDRDGKIFATYPLKPAKEHIPAAPGTAGYKFRDYHLEGFQPVIQGDSLLGTLYLKSDINAIYDWFRLFAFVSVFVILLMFAVAWVLSLRLYGSITRPVLDLAQTAKIISDQHDYSVRATKYGEDEIGALTNAFNHMLEEIQQKDSEITSFNTMLEQRIRDRTQELEVAYDTLKQQNELVETIVDSSVDIITVFDKELRFVVVNKKAEELYGMKREELIGKSIISLFPVIAGMGIIEDLKKVLEGESEYRTEFQSPTSNLHLEIFYVPLRDHMGDIYRVLVISHDITKIIEVNEQLRTLNSELSQSNRDLEQFASVASHDLQEPLRKIQIFSELAAKAEPHDENHKLYLSKVNSSADRMARLIRAVLNYSRISITNEKTERVDLNNILEQVKGDLELMIMEKSAVIIADELPTVDGIPLQLSQLFLNLLSNSMKFTDSPPEIRITSTVLSASQMTAITQVTAQHKFVELVFSDNGIGFEQQLADKAFAIFQRLHSPKKYAGTGIGLALCKKIIENHHGFIHVVSRPGIGTSFFIYLPFTD